MIPCPSDILNGMAFTDRDYAAAYGLTNLNGEVEGETMECGIVMAPENYAEPDGRQIELFYMRLFCSSKSPAADPLIYLSGGPGIAGTHEVAVNPLSGCKSTGAEHAPLIYAQDPRTDIPAHLLARLMATLAGSDAVIVQGWLQQNLARATG